MSLLGEDSITIYDYDEEKYDITVQTSLTIQIINDITVQTLLTIQSINTVIYIATLTLIVLQNIFNLKHFAEEKTIQSCIHAYTCTKTGRQARHANAKKKGKKNIVWEHLYSRGVFVSMAASGRKELKDFFPLGVNCHFYADYVNKFPFVFSTIMAAL